MYWRLAFKKTKKRVFDGIFGEDVHTITYCTSSPVKKRQMIQVYHDQNFKLVNHEKVESAIPNGYDGTPLTNSFWRPNLTGKQVKDLAPLFLAEEPPNKSSLAVERKLTKTDDSVCGHKFNCEAHREVCMKQYGCGPIVSTPEIER